MAFKKGQSGNPGGRSKEKPFADALRMEIAAAGEDHKALRRVAKVLIENAESGDIRAIRELADRLDGKPMQAVEASVDASVDSLTSLLERFDGKNRMVDFGSDDQPDH